MMVHVCCVEGIMLLVAFPKYLPKPLDVNTISRDGAVTTSQILVFLISGIAAICAVAVCVFIYSTVNGAPVVAAPLYAPAAKIE